MGLIAWLIFGALVGWVSSMIAGTDKQQGWILNIVLGIIGAVLGGAVYSALFDDGFSVDWSIGSMIVAIIGGVVVALGYAMLTNNRSRI
jgi:uncharacterized membrane protein YeaQ/YmgE (transglycosylase-associated protein family)